MKRIAIIASLVALVMAASTTAKAETFVWTDPHQDYSISFPDNWMIQTVDNPNNTFRIAGPVAEDMATCKVDVQDDGRLQIFPKPLVDEAVYETLTRDFWMGRVGMFSNSKIVDYKAPAGLGDKGDATAVHVTFTQDDGTGNDVNMYGLMIASIYADKMYVASCSSKHDVYSRYKKLFSSIIGSMQLEAKYNIFATGYYRNFLMDDKFVIRRTKPGTADATLGQNWWDYAGLND